MKKVLIGIVCFMCIFLTGCTDGKDLVEISYDELATKIENEESFVLYVGWYRCGDCQILNEKEYHEAEEKYGRKSFKAEMGAEALGKLLAEVDIEQLSKELS